MWLVTVFTYTDMDRDTQLMSYSVNIHSLFGNSHIYSVRISHLIIHWTHQTTLVLFMGLFLMNFWTDVIFWISLTFMARTDIFIDRLLMITDQSIMSHKLVFSNSLKIKPFFFRVMYIHFWKAQKYLTHVWS